MILLYNISFQQLEIEEPAGSLEVDVLELMEKRLWRYVVNCLQAAGYDDLEAIAVAEGEKSNCISAVEEHIKRRHKSNADMLPPVAYQSL